MAKKPKKPSSRNPIAGSRHRGLTRVQIIPNKKKPKRHDKHKGQEDEI